MLRITIELLPGGMEAAKRTLGVAEIANDMTGDQELSNYRMALFKWGKGKRVWRRGGVREFPRKVFGPWDLLLACLVDALADRLPRWKKVSERLKAQREGQKA